jgi:competence protein ComEC
MHPFSDIPILRLLLPFAGGIVIAIFTALDVPVIVIFAVCCFSVLFAFFKLKMFVRSFSLRWVFGVAAFFLMFCLGFIATRFSAGNFSNKHYQKINSQKSFYVIRLTEPYHIKERSLKIQAEVVAVKNNGVWHGSTGKILVYIEPDSMSKMLNYGDLIFSSQPLQPIQPPQNPGAFNYKRFLSFHGIYDQIYLPSGTWKYMGKGTAYALFKVAFQLREQFIKQLQQYIQTPNEVAVCSALLIGYKDFLDSELLDAYASAGALHVLCVSGLHVGLIYVMLQSLLIFMDKKKWSLVVKQFLIIAFVWFYAMLTGLAPSILRSATMITLIVIAKYRKSDSYMLNTTLGSAFILLNINPYMITEVGFQLSYLAVFGIVYLHQRLAQLYIAPNWLLHQIWQLTSVSFCAQLMTFPLGILYFNQFPTLFLVSNLLVIPIATFLMYVSIVAIALSVIPFVSILAPYVWKISFGLAWFMNKTVLAGEKLPFAMIKGIFISIPQVWMIYAMIAFALWFLLYKNKTALLLFFTASVLFTCWVIWDEYIIVHQKKLIVYALNKNTAIELIDGRSRIFICNDSLMNDQSSIRFNIQRYWYETGINKFKHISFYQKKDAIAQNDFNQNHQQFCKKIKQRGDFIYAAGKIIYVPTGWIPKKTDAKKMKVDYVILTSRFKNKIPTLIENVEADKIILDGSFYAKKNTNGNNSVSIYDVKQSGAFMADL